MHFAVIEIIKFKVIENYRNICIKVEALCVLWASGQVNADLQAIEKALQASGSKVGYFAFLFNLVSICLII